MAIDLSKPEQELLVALLETELDGVNGAKTEKVRELVAVGPSI
jgi:hypothetical protein